MSSSDSNSNINEEKKKADTDDTDEEIDDADKKDATNWNALMAEMDPQIPSTSARAVGLFTPKRKQSNDHISTKAMLRMDITGGHQRTETEVSHGTDDTTEEDVPELMDETVSAASLMSGGAVGGGDEIDVDSFDDEDTAFMEEFYRTENIFFRNSNTQPDDNEDAAALQLAQHVYLCNLLENLTFDQE